MLNVEKINSNVKFKSNTAYDYKLNSLEDKPAVKKAYYDMNKSVYLDYVDGDISLARVLANKLGNFWNIVFKKDPLLELKARIIEEGLKESAKDGLHFNAIV